MKHKGAALRSTYGIANNELSDTPLSYKQYLQFLLKSTTWGEDIVIYAISDLFRLKITSINTVRLDEYRCRHNQSLRDVDAVLIFNGSNHYSYAGKWSFVLVTGRLSMGVYGKPVICNSKGSWDILTRRLSFKVVVFAGRK